jgi:uncharacterized repeat protein (TIGR01451 family)
MRTKLKKAIQLIAIIMIGIFMVATVVVFAHKTSDKIVLANGPIPPPVGYPKLTISAKVVTPTLAAPDPNGVVLEYSIEILNTGAYSASDVTLEDAIPSNTNYNDDVQSSAQPNPEFTDGVITWGPGEIGFDDSVVITFSVTITDGYEGIISNIAVISDPMITEPVSVMAETRITDHPMFEIFKTATPALPGKNKPLTYELVVTNLGQKAENIPIIVTDFVPENTTFRSAGQGSSFNSIDNVVTWSPSVNLGFGETTTFSFSVEVGDVPSGTVISNNDYLVVSEEGFGIGEPYATTVIDPIFILSKSIYPDPPGSNNEMTYTLTVLNLGSMATDLVITDTVPEDVEYISGGDSYVDGIVTWSLPSLDVRESAQVTFTVFIPDIANIIVLNGDYGVCSAEGVCVPGISVPSLIVGPTFEATATLDPIAHKPGGGNAPVTPTLTIQNLGPGNALDATALLTFGRISISTNDMVVIPPVGTLVDGPPCNTGFPCTNFLWIGNLAVGDLITFTTLKGQSTVVGKEGTHYTATVVITDDLSGYVTEPITATAIGHITHYANLIPTKSAPPQIGPGQIMTYTIQVFDSGLSTEESPAPILTETVPTSVTLLDISDGGISQTIDGRTMISWTLPAMGPGDYLYRTFEVMANPDLVSGTLIINDDYRTSWNQKGAGTFSNLGESVTTTVHEVGLIDSYKTVSPTWALPGTGTVLTYEVHVVNSGPNLLSGVQVSDIFPWQNSTYQRDAVASAGSLVSDIVSFEWTGDLAPYSEQLITFTTLVDDFFEGVLTNTATITHTSLKQDVIVTAAAYITDKPVLRISKIATPDPVMVGSPLLYQIQLTNLGQQATRLVVTDTIPANTSYIFGSASSGGHVVGDMVQWSYPVLDPGDTLTLTFQVTVQGGYAITHHSYAVRCGEGLFAYGDPIITRVSNPMKTVLLPLIIK